MASLGGGADCHDQSMVVTDGLLRDLAAWLTQVPGVVGVLLGGSRARGDHMPDSDVDLGLYYRPPLDVAALAELAREVAGPQARVTQPGEWGPWVDGGGWLTIAGTAVDWIYRDLDRVWTAWQDAQRGRFRFHAQVGNPLGVPDFAYAGEVALGVVLADATGELASLQRRTSAYPRALADTLVQGLWEATFLIDIARKAVSRADTSYVAGCLFRVVGLCAHALHGYAGRWLINEKGAVASAGRVDVAPADFAARAHGVLAHVGSSPAELAAALEAAAELVRETAAACQPSR
jgi:predicted nucleotidyltransferase